MTNEQRVNVLFAHQAALEMADTFEAFKARQIAYVKLLIDIFGDEDKIDKTIADFIDGAYL